MLGDSCNCPPSAPASGRRKFLQFAALSSGISLLAGPSLFATAHAAGATDALLLSCMDYRLVDEVEQYMTSRGLRNRYDHVILAGASLGAITDKFPAWNQTFWEHLDVAIKLHGIRKVMLLDHRGCGAYKVILGPEHATDAQKEKSVHAAQLRTLKEQIGEKYPQLEVELLLMGLDGQVEVIHADAKTDQRGAPAGKS